MKPREIAALRQRGSKGGGTGSTYTAATRQTATVTSSTLANGASWTGTILLGASYRLFAISTSAAARVRLYVDNGSAVADASRPLGIDPAPGDGVVLEYVTSATHLSGALSPMVSGASLETPPDKNIDIVVTNLSGGSSAITVTLTFVEEEV